MDLALMVEGQEGVSWQRWLELAATTEELGYQALMRSDHYLSVDGRHERGGALDAWGTICALAAVTSRIRLGTLVSPVTFRPPAVLAKLALTADHVSGGRIDVGMGTGWLEAEHEHFGFPFPPMGERMDELERQLEAVERFWREDPRPVQRPRPWLVMGGQAKRRSAALAARHADEYNLLYADPAVVRERAARLGAACDAAGRDPATLRISVMTGFVVGADRADLHRRARAMAEWRGGGTDDPEGWLRERAEGGRWLIGTPEDVVGQLRALEEAGVSRVMLQHHRHDDFGVVSLIGREVLPAVSER